MARRSAPLAAAGFFAFAALASLCRLWSFRVALWEDTGAYLYVGDTILHGGSPYADAADNKGPVLYLIFALVRLVTDHSTTLVRLSAVVFCALAALAVAAYVARSAGLIAGAVGGAALAVFGSSPVLEGQEPNTEQIGIAPLAAAWWLATRPGWASAAAAGALAAAAVLINVGFAAILPVIAIQLWVARDEDAGWTRLLTAVAGGLAVAVPVVAWLALTGALDDAWTQVIHSAYSKVDGTGEVGDFRHSLLDVPGRYLPLLGAAGAVIALAVPRLRTAAALALLWIALAWLRVKLASYEYVHFYYVEIPGVAAGVALGCAGWWELTASWSRLPAAKAIRVAAPVLALALAAWHYTLGEQRTLFEEPIAARVTYPEYSIAYPVADRLRAMTHAGDDVLVAGDNPTVYWRARRRTTGRFFADYPLESNPAYVPERRAWLRAHPPDAVAFIVRGSKYEPDTRAFVRRNGYRRAWSRGRASIWLRR